MTKNPTVRVLCPLKILLFVLFFHASVCIVIESCSFYTYILDYVGFMLDSRWVFIFTSPAHPSFADIDADADPDLIWM